MMAHVANFSQYRKQGGGDWTRKDFVRLKYDEVEEESKQSVKKLTLKEWKTMLGSKFNMNAN